MGRITLRYSCGHTATMTPEQARAVAPSGRLHLTILCLPCRMRRVGLRVVNGQPLGRELEHA